MERCAKVSFSKRICRGPMTQHVLRKIVAKYEVMGFLSDTPSGRRKPASMETE